MGICLPPALFAGIGIGPVSHVLIHPPPGQRRAALRSESRAALTQQRRTTGLNMIVRIEIHRADAVYEYRVVADGDVLFDDTGFSSVVHCLVGAVEGLPPEVRAVEVACGGIVSGTYPLTVLAGSVAQVAQHAVNTTAAVWEALQS